MALEEMLPSAEFLSIVAFDGHQALCVLKSQKVDVLVTDIMMPGMNGVELASQTKAILPELPIILITGYFARPEEAQNIGRLLNKPVRAEELERAIREAVGF